MSQLEDFSVRQNHCSIRQNNSRGAHGIIMFFKIYYSVGQYGLVITCQSIIFEYVFLQTVNMYDKPLPAILHNLYFDKKK